jgi:hypothetical protein
MIIYPGILPHGALVAPNGVQVYYNSTLTSISGIVVEFDSRLMQVMSSAVNPQLLFLCLFGLKEFRWRGHG